MEPASDLFDLEHDPKFALYYNEFREAEIRAGRDPEQPCEDDIRRLWDGFEQWIEEYVPGEAARLVEQIRSRHSVTERSFRQVRVASAVEQHWSEALHRFSELTEAYERIVSRTDARLRQAEELAPWSYHARAILGARGAATAVEIEVLARHGLLAGTWARWRTLYELAVIAKYISRHGERIAEAYCFHQIPQRHELLKAMRARTPSEALTLLVDAHEKSVAGLKTPEQFGTAFPTAYGWAARPGGVQKPSLADLIKDVGMGSAHLEYLQANRAVHGGPGGHLDFLSDQEVGTRPWQGARWLGEPLAATAGMLTDLAGSLVSKMPPPDDCALLTAISQLRDEVYVACAQAEAAFAPEDTE